MKNSLSNIKSIKSIIGKAVLTFSVSSLLMLNMQAQEATEFNPRLRPTPLEEVTFDFPEYQQFKLSNGLTVFAIEDNEAPIIEFRLLIPGGNAFDKIAGQSDFLSLLMTKGYGDIDARKFADMMDGKGISIGASAGLESFSFSGSSLTEHQDIMWDGLKGMLLNPSLPEDELDKLKPQMMANLKSAKGSPGALASKLSRKVIFGNNHPYAQSMDESDIEKLEIEDIKEYFNTYIKPDGASILVVGDFKYSGIKNKLESVLGSWKGVAESINSVPPAVQEPLGVYFIPRPGSVQSSIRYLSPATEFTDTDREVLHLASGIISGGFSGRLFKTLREKHSYTYSPTGTLTSYKLFNYLMAGSDVRNNVTDSAIAVIQSEINDLAKNGPTDVELAIMKKYQIGNYNMSFEDPSFAGYIIQNAFFKGQPLEYAKGFTKRKAGMSAAKVKKAVRDYLIPQKSYLVVVGDPSVRESLKKFGTIYDYNDDVMPVSGEDAVMKKISDSPKDIIEDYEDAIGGPRAISAVKNIIADGTVEMTMNGQPMKGNILSYKMADGRFSTTLTLPGMERKLKYDGRDIKLLNNDIPEGVTGPAKDVMLLEESLFPVLKLSSSDAELTTLGSQGGMKLVKAVLPDGKEQIYYFNADTKLLDRYTETVSTPTGTVEAVYNISGYRRFGDITLPTVKEIDTPMFSNRVTTNYSVNQDIDETIFKIEKRR